MVEKVKRHIERPQNYTVEALYTDGYEEVQVCTTYSDAERIKASYEAEEGILEVRIVE